MWRRMKKLLVVVASIFSISFLSLFPLVSEASNQRSHVHVQLVETTESTDELPAAGGGTSTGKTTAPRSGTSTASTSNKRLPKTNEVTDYLVALFGTLLVLGVGIIVLVRRKANEA